MPHPKLLLNHGPTEPRCATVSVCRLSLISTRCRAADLYAVVRSLSLSLSLRARHYRPRAIRRAERMFISHELSSAQLNSSWLDSRVVSVLDSGTEWPGFQLQSRRCRVTVLGKLFTPIVPLFTKQRNW